MQTILSRLTSQGKHNLGALDYFLALEEGLSSFLCDHYGLIAFRDPLVSLSPFLSRSRSLFLAGPLAP
jgi:hypothetical protein